MNIINLILLFWEYKIKGWINANWIENIRYMRCLRLQIWLMLDFNTLCVLLMKNRKHMKPTHERILINNNKNPLFIETSKFQAIVEIAFEIYGRREFKRKLCCNCTNGQLFWYFNCGVYRYFGSWLLPFGLSIDFLFKRLLLRVSITESVRMIVNYFNIKVVWVLG